MRQLVGMWSVSEAAAPSVRLAGRCLPLPTAVSKAEQVL